MKLSSRKIEREKRIELSMTSMIDVVFLLLIFFMTTASFVKTERQLDSAIRVKNKTAEQALSDLEPAIVEVVPSGDRFLYQLGTREITSDEELTRVLESFPNKEDGAFVRVSDGAPFRMAAAAIQACKTAGFATVSYVPLSAGG
ncbi:MAG TPA: biopolymer transporter ExbD [Thermoguttaceae bacterium]|nr:biopolymer transporter ExbD [Thermoguttaceae bacterium]